MAAAERSEIEILRRKMTLRFGEQRYDVTVLGMDDAATWREAFFAETKDIARLLGGETNGRDEQFFTGLGLALIGFPDKLTKLVTSYASTLPWDEIRKNGATDEEMGEAFSAIMRVAFPYWRQISLIGTITRITSGLSASQGSTS